MSVDITGDLNNKFGEVSSKNSSQIPLGIGESFIGEIENVSDFSLMTFTVTSNIMSANKGLELQTSINGNNFDIIKKISINTPVKDDIGNVLYYFGVHTLIPTAKYFRIKYTNSDTVQQFLRLQTMYHRYKSKALTATVRQTISQENDCDLIRNVNDWEVDVNRGLISGHSYDHVIGRCPIITTLPTIIAGDCPLVPPFPMVEEPIRIAAGGNINDDITGTGVRSILVLGLDINMDVITEIIETAGTSASSFTSQSFFRINRIKTLDNGTYGGANLGDMSIENTSGLVMSFVPALFGKSTGSMWSIPRNFTGYLTRIDVNVANTKPANVRLFLREKADQIVEPFGPCRFIWSIDEMVGNKSETFQSFRVIPQKSDLWLSGESTVGPTTTINTTYDLLIVPNIIV